MVNILIARQLKTDNIFNQLNHLSYFKEKLNNDAIEKIIEERYL